MILFLKSSMECKINTLPSSKEIIFSVKLDEGEAVLARLKFGSNWTSYLSYLESLVRDNYKA